jgi:putative membrane protein
LLQPGPDPKTPGPSILGPRRGALLAILGVAGLAFMVDAIGWADVADSFRKIGWGMLALVLFHAVPMAFDTLGWRALGPWARSVRVTAWYRLRWIGESVNNLLPVAQVGGELVRAHLLGRRTDARPQSAATVIVDFAIGLLSKVVLAAVGLLMLPGAGSPDQGGAVTNLALGLLAFAVLTGGTLAALRHGALQRIVGLVRRLMGWDEDHILVVTAQDLDSSVIALSKDRPRVLRCFVWRTTGWAVAGAELWLICYFLGVDAGVAGLLAVHFLSFVARSAGFVLPGAIGVQEGAFVVVGALIGLSPADALAMALAVRVREILFGLPGLALALRSRP